MTEKRDAYVQKLKAKMDEWNAEIDKIEAKADQADAESKIEYEKQLEDLRAKRKDVEDKMAELQQAGDGAWEDLKAGMDNAWDSLGNALKSATSRFK
ncbi:MAG: coiled coil domain-containing protein [Deltaproteobacteria bacterium]|nr:coiled coil domain-containing protein [Deltaproteobacteria bacterium]